MVSPVGWLSLRCLKKKSPEGCRGSGSSIGSYQHLWLPEGLNVREPGHHDCLHGVKSVIVVSVEGTFTVSKIIGVAEVRGSSTVSTITILTPWRPPWLPGSWKCPGRRLRICWLFFWKPAKESSTGATKTLRTPWRPPWWPNSRTCPGRRVRSLVPLPL